jgi:two-component sensor histidine kinase
MSEADDRPGRPTSTVGFRLSLVLGLALLPLLALALAQNRSLSRQAMAQLEASLLGQAVSTAQPQIDAIRSARVMAGTLAVAMQDVGARVGPACSLLMRRVVASDSRVSVAGYVPADGRMVCASAGAPYDFSDNPTFRRLASDPGPQLSVASRGTLTKEPVITATHPILVPDGTFAGFAFVSIPHRLIPGADSAGQTTGPAGSGKGPEFLTFDADGTILTSTLGLDRAKELVPYGASLRDLAHGAARTFTSSPPDAPTRTHAIVPLSDGNLFLLGAWPGDRMERVIRLSQVGYALPVLIWLTCVLGARLISTHSVTRHIDSVRRAMMSFAGGRRVLIPLNVETAPAEIHDLGVSFSDMAERLLKDEAELENMVHQRDVLLREVHHRVKNNLQLMASMMNLQIRHAKSHETKEMMRAVQERVMNLAVIHRELYQTTGEMAIHASELLGHMVSRVTRLGRCAARGIEVTTGFDELSLTPDQAIALSLVVNECLTTMLGRGDQVGAGEEDDHISTVSVFLRRIAPDADGTAASTAGNGGQGVRPEVAGMAELEILLMAPPGIPAPPGPDGLSSMLIMSFARQLGSDAVQTERDGAFRLSIAFQVVTPGRQSAGEPLGSFALSERSSMSGRSVGLPGHAGPTAS